MVGAEAAAERDAVQTRSVEAAVAAAPERILVCRLEPQNAVLAVQHRDFLHREEGRQVGKATTLKFSEAAVRAGLVQHGFVVREADAEVDREQLELPLALGPALDPSAFAPPFGIALHVHRKAVGVQPVVAQPVIETTNHGLDPVGVTLDATLDRVFTQADDLGHNGHLPFVRFGI